MPCIVGVDFDNTVVSYDKLMHNVALDLGFIAPDTAKDKEAIRNKVRGLPEGEKKWRRIQAIAYGEAMEHAILIDGVKEFFDRCSAKGIKACIISHKGEYAAEDQKNINLRNAALDWMDKNKFFDRDGLGLSRDNIYFESTRREKVERIRKTDCMHFIDDLEETFLEDAFPSKVNKILFAPHGKERDLENIKVFNSWSGISEHIFN